MYGQKLPCVFHSDSVCVTYTCLIVPSMSFSKTYLKSSNSRMSLCVWICIFTRVRIFKRYTFWNFESWNIISCRNFSIHHTLPIFPRRLTGARGRSFLQSISLTWPILTIWVGRCPVIPFMSLLDLSKL